MAETLTIFLNPPVKVGAGQLSQLVLREPTGREMHGAEGKMAAGVTPSTVDDYQVALLGTVAGIGEAERDAAIGALPITIMRQALAYFEAFNANSGRRPDPLPAVLELPVDVTSGGITYTKLILQEPTVGQRRRANMVLAGGQDIATRRQYQMVLVAQVSGMPFTAVQELPVSALNDAEAYCMGFIAPGPTTGNS